MGMIAETDAQRASRYARMEPSQRRAVDSGASRRALQDAGRIGFDGTSMSGNDRGGQPGAPRMESLTLRIADTAAGPEGGPRQVLEIGIGGTYRRFALNQQLLERLGRREGPVVLQDGTAPGQARIEASPEALMAAYTAASRLREEALARSTMVALSPAEKGDAPIRAPIRLERGVGGATFTGGTADVVVFTGHEAPDPMPLTPAVRAAIARDSAEGALFRLPDSPGGASYAIEGRVLAAVAGIAPEALRQVEPGLPRPQPSRRRDDTPGR